MVSSFPNSKTISVGVGLGVLLGMEVGPGVDEGNDVLVVFSVGTSTVFSRFAEELGSVEEAGRLQPAVISSNKSGSKYLLSIFFIIHLIPYWLR